MTIVADSSPTGRATFAMVRRRDGPEFGDGMDCPFRGGLFGQG